MEHSKEWGFVSPDGYFQTLNSLTVESLLYVSKSLNELQEMLKIHEFNEEYEKCILIFKEIEKRKK